MTFKLPVVRCGVELDRRGVRPSPFLEAADVVWAAEPCAIQQAMEAERAAGRDTVTLNMVCHCPLCSPRC